MTTKPKTRLEEIKERCANTSPGTWHVEMGKTGFELWSARMRVASFGFAEFDHDNALFCACAQDDIPRLISEVERLRALCHEAYEAWTGSEIGFQEETAPEVYPDAYCQQVIQQMLEPIRRALEEEPDK